MKIKFLILTLMLFFSACKSQDSLRVGDKDSLNSTNTLLPYLNSFIKDACENNLNVRLDILEQVDSIAFDPCIEYPDVGFYNSQTKLITMTPFVSMDTLIMKSVLYHELGHALLGEHFRLHSCYSCNEIMSAYLPLSSSHLADPKVWKQQVRDFFKYIEENTTLNLRD